MNASPAPSSFRYSTLDPVGSTARAAAQDVLDAALAADQRDDRFAPPWPIAGLLAAVEFAEGLPSGYLGGEIDDDRLVLDGLLSQPAVASSGRAAALWQQLATLVSIDDHPSKRRPSQLELWGRPAMDWHEAFATALGLSPHRALHQLRCQLPDDAEPLQTRPFDPSTDASALLQVNNRAFASHPDQGGMTMGQLEAKMAEPWFEPDGLRVADDPNVEGRLLGFCWTKVHKPVAPEQPELGEVYVIGVDPDHHGKGFGVPMTAAGLAWLAGQGLETGMLYVEADNQPALATYFKLGFNVHRTDRSWLGPLLSADGLSTGEDHGRTEGTEGTNR